MLLFTIEKSQEVVLHALSKFVTHQVNLSKPDDLPIGLNDLQRCVECFFLSLFLLVQKWLENSWETEKRLEITKNGIIYSISRMTVITMEFETVILKSISTKPIFELKWQMSMERCVTARD